ncbi:MAG: tRNA-intron lyase [Desulfurococcales archaeon]|nr:tRNA-intron lyase [Desulfurococcales archaeon]
MKIRALLHNNTIIVTNYEDAKKLYDTGFYGKPLGIEKPGKEEWSAPLILSRLEALYLLEKNIIEVYRLGDTKPLTAEDIRLLMSRKELLLYTVYRDLRDRGLVVRSGLKFGAPFAVYRFGPGIDHAPYIVQVLGSDEEMDPIDIVRAGRLGHSVKKTYVIARVDGDRVNYIIFKWFKP